MIDAVLSYHLNPATCGVAKFNHRLAQELGVPCLPLNEFGPRLQQRHVLVSMKPSEMPPSDVWWYSRSYDLVLHDRTLAEDHPIIRAAKRVWYADEVGCPSTLSGDPTRGHYRVLVFGMAHKILLPHFERLKIELDRDHPNYTVELSTAVHEGSPWDQTLTDAAESMRHIFGDHLRVLGFLADDALAKELQDVDAVALFYHPALRANNTTAWAALAAAKHLYTNRDEHSPVKPPTWESLVATITGVAVEV